MPTARSGHAKGIVGPITCPPKAVGMAPGAIVSRPNQRSKTMKKLHKYGLMTKRQLQECFIPYRESFPDWSVVHDVVLVRECGPIQQSISLTALSTRAYRPFCTIELHFSIPDNCHILDQTLDIKHRQVKLSEHPTKWPAILKAAKKSGVKHYFIEDESPTSVQQIPLSLRFLERVKF